jgi:hypothetical protein
MTFRMTFRLALLVAFLGALLWLVRNRFLSERPERLPDRRLISVAAEDVTGVSIRRGGVDVVCVRGPDGWRIEQPLKAGADAAVMERLVSVFEVLTRQETVTEAQRRARGLTLGDYGLAAPTAVLGIQTARGRYELAIGHAAVVGDSVYVRLDAEPDIVATAGALLAVTPRSLDDVRDRRLLRGEPFRVARLDLSWAGASMRLAREGTRWMVLQPVRFRADNAVVEGLLQNLLGLGADRFVWDPAHETNRAAGVRIETYGLGADEATLRAGAWLAEDEIGQELVVGKPMPDDPDRMFAKLRGSDSVFAVKRQVAERCRVALQDLLDRNVFPIQAGDVERVEIRQGNRSVQLLRGPDAGWSLVEPVKWKADDGILTERVQSLVDLKVAAFVEGAARPQESLGFSPPWCSVLLAGAAGTTAPPVERLLVSSLPAKDGYVLARFEQADTVFRLPADTLARLGPSPGDPLAYRDRRMLAIPPEAVSRLSRVRAGQEQTVVRDTDGNWTAVAPPNRAPSLDAVTHILAALTSLRALRIEYHGPENTDAYGLNETATVLTVGVSAGQGIRKSLLMGYRAKTDGIYAMVQGQDVIFVLEKGLVARLTADLVVPAAEGAAPRPEPPQE